MNKIYRTVWNKALGAFVAASELDRSQGKGTAGVAGGVADERPRHPGGPALDGGASRRAIAIAAMGCTLGIGMAQSVHAQTVGNGTVTGRDSTAISNPNCNFGGATASDSGGVGAIAIGCSTNASAGGVAVGEGSRATASSVAVGQAATASGDGAVALGPLARASNTGDVALGAGASTAAPNPTASASIGGVSYNFAGANPFAVVSVGGQGTTRQITNVAAGQVNATSTDAVNGSQLNAAITAINSLSTSTSTGISSLSTRIMNLSTTLNNISIGNDTYFKVNDPGASAAQASGIGAVAGGGGAAASGTNAVALGKNATAAGDNSVAIGAGSVATAPNTVSFGAPGSERRLTNVAPAVNGTDAVNLNQVNGAVAAGVSQANSYTDKRIADTNKAIGDVAKHAYSGIAAATALTMIPEVDLGKSIAVGVGGATFQGHAAAAIGVSARLTENLKLKAGVGLSGGGNTYGGGVSYQW
ncbi:YadA-like family protein [Burkholderia ubonensis]|uniref:YadA-like family protein n=1 Tax=Burkholderia ubonensis TaxID=101571 RepID=UPI0009B2FD4A